MRPSESAEEVFLSVVMVGRNDNYGGDFRDRAQHCVNGLVQHLVELNVRSELIFVNYNPLPEPDISSFLDWPERGRMTDIHILTVPGEVHEAVVAEGVCRNVPVLEYVAKNAGIRKARGRYILCMNPDITLPIAFKDLILHLRADCFYRADRINYERLEQGEPQSFTSLMMKGHTVTLGKTDRTTIAIHKVKNELRCAWKRFTPRIEGLLNFLECTVYYNHVEFRLHCNASGDFMLMHRDSWHQLRGYRERAEIALHVDSLMVVQAAALGLGQRTLSNPIQHKEHGRRYDGSIDKPENARAYDFLLKEAQKMRDSGQAANYNDGDWGLSNFVLPLLTL